MKNSIPKEGSRDVGPYFWRLWEEAVAEKERLHITERLLEGYRLFRGAHWKNPTLGRNSSKKITANLLFANIQRTVANITARAPVAEVVSIDNEESEVDDCLSDYVRKWNNESESAKSLASSVLNMETYGITVEKATFNPETEITAIVVVDPMAFAPAPGYYETLNDCPYLTHAYQMPVEIIESTFNKPGKVEGEEELRPPGHEREDNRPIPAGSRVGVQNYPGNYAANPHPQEPIVEKKAPALVVEVWVRDYTTEKIKQLVENPETGEVAEIEVEREKYPGGIRVVTLTNHGRLVLADRGNPNVNPEIPRELTSKSFLYNHYPFWKANSYEDTSSLWGFSAAEQVGDINLKINELLTRLSGYLNRVTLPPLIIPKDTGITLSQVNNKPGLVLQPVNSNTANAIRYLQVPNLPSNFFEALQWYVQFFDRISQIEDADRGAAPNGVIAAKAIAALQERGAVMIRAKIRAVDYLVRQRGRCVISFFQNFGLMPQTVSLDDTPVQITGTQFLGRKFNYIVESGSTVAKTTLQVQEQAMELYTAGAIDRQALLETLNFPGWKAIVERSGEGQLDQALSILVSAGMDKETAMELKQYLMQSQGGPGDAGPSLEQKPEQPPARPVT
jgi:hypothetical protein